MSTQGIQAAAAPRPACLDDADRDLDDTAVLAWIIRMLPGGRRRYGCRGMAEAILDMLEAEDIVMARTSELAEEDS